MKSCLIQRVERLDDLYNALVAQLDLPEAATENLDALYDGLLNEIDEPFEIVWRNTDAARAALGADLYTTVLEILSMVAKERGDITLDIHH